MIKYDKDEIRNSLQLSDIYQLLEEWGGEPVYTNFGIVSATICHNKPNVGSRKLYYYENSGLFQCYTNCGYFDIFELVCKIAAIQKNLEFKLYDAVKWIAKKFHLNFFIEESDEDELEILPDWQKLSDYDRIQKIEFKPRKNVVLKEYDNSILDRFNYQVRLDPWLKENISQEVLNEAHIGFYPKGNQITIPHYDIDNRFIGLRGRTVSEEDSILYGKYMPLKINHTLYNHPLGMNLYNLNHSKENIKTFKKAIIFEAEKSTLQFRSLFSSDITVACCGSSISFYQFYLLEQLGVQEIIIAFDRQFKEVNDSDYVKLKKMFLKIYKIYGKYITLSFILDRYKITNYKASPIDEGKEKFLKLFKERIVL